MTLRATDKSFLEISRSASNLLVNYKEDTREEILARSSYKEVKSFTQRIDKLGIIREIEIYPSALTDLLPIKLDQTTKDYVKSIENQFFLGDVQRIEGKVTKLYLDTNSIEIVRGPKDIIKVSLNASDFEKVRRAPGKNPVVVVIGRPRYKIDLENTKFDEFEGAQVVFE